MRKVKITKIICTAVAAISAAALAFAPACSANWSGVSGDKDTATKAVEGANGGFVTETEDYVYFINGKAANTDENNFGSVLKGSVQRIKKDDLNAGNYAETQTVVPSVIYSGTYNAGLYIYGGYLYYTTPTTERNSDGEILNSNLDFKRTKLDGSDTTGTYIWQSSDNCVDYRYVEVGETVYIIYALSEKLNDTSTSAINVHSINCTTGENTILAYNVSAFAFDTVDAENPYIYYTMNVPQYFGGSNYGYNQLYRVRADVTESPREYNFDDVEDYDAEEDPVYINRGDYVFDGVGLVNNSTENRIGQLNFGYWSNKKYTLVHDDYTYEIKWYKDGTLYYTRKSSNGTANLYTLTDEQLGKNADGKVNATWDAVEENEKQTPLINEDVSTDYTYVTFDDNKLYAFELSSGSIKRQRVEDGKLTDEVTIPVKSASSVIGVRKENGHWNMYYATSGNGMTVNRVAIDGAESDYRGLDSILDPDKTFEGIRILDLDACSSWYMPEFVGNKLLFASETDGMTAYNYIMVCDLGTKDGAIMSNKEIGELNEKFNGVAEKAAAYEEEESSDGTPYYDGLTEALEYVFRTGDTSYFEELNQAYIDVEGRDEYYAYSEDSLKIIKDFLAAEGDWEKNEDGDTVVNYKTDVKKINGNDVHSNSVEYYYSVLGRMTEEDAEGLLTGYKNSLKTYPVDDSTWWEGLSTGGKVGFIIGMVAAGLAVIAGVTVLVVFLVKRKKGREEVDEKKITVDITDDKAVDVYGNGEEKNDE